MIKHRIVAIAFTMLASLAVLILPNTANAQDALDSATGAGSTTNDLTSPGFLHFDFTAESGPSGENALGAVNFVGGVFPGQGETPTFSGVVTCLRVVGNVAYIGGTTEFTFRGSTFRSFFFSAQDNGLPVNGQSPDLISSVHIRQTPPADPCNQGVQPEFPLTSGDIVIGDNVVSTITPATVTLSPLDAVNNVGTTHTVTATVRGVSGDPVQGVTVRFTVQGGSSTSGICTTDTSGQCSFTYTGPQLPGADVITGCADSNENGTADVGEPCGEATKAWILPTSTPGQVTGGGQILNAQRNDKIAFGFTANSMSTGVKGRCTVVDPSAAVNIKISCLDATTLVQAGTHATFFGQATVNGVATNYRIDIDDLGEPGRDRDTFKIQTDSGYTAGGVLQNGNVQIHDA